ncbi:MAG TPA: MFS transporter [Actinomycetota bacterium]|nr:MFS transporter [Actinomycetota bacterium]
MDDGEGREPNQDGPAANRPDGNESRAGGEYDPIDDAIEQTAPMADRPWQTRLRAHLVDLTPLRTSRQFRLLWIGQSVSDVGSHLTMVAIPFQMFALTHSTLAVGLIGLFELVPLLVLPVIGGAIADAMDRRRLLLLAHLVLAALSGVLALNATAGHVWVLYVVTALEVSMYSLFLPAMRSLVPRFVDHDVLPSAMALSSAYGSFGALAGPILGGVLIAAFGLRTAYLVDLATYAWALGTLWLMAPAPPHEDAERFSWESVRQGVRFLKGRKVLQSTFTFDLNAMIFGMPTALFPAVADRLGGGAGVVGLLYAAPYAGAFVVSLFSGRAKHVRRQGLAVELAIVVWGVSLVAFGLSTTLWASLLFLAVAGGGDQWSAIFRSTILQTVVPDEMRGRLSGVELTVVAAGPALGDLEAGAVASLTSVPFSIVLGGALCLAGVGVLSRLVPEFGRYDARNPTP